MAPGGERNAEKEKRRSINHLTLIDSESPFLPDGKNRFLLLNGNTS